MDNWTLRGAVQVIGFLIFAIGAIGLLIGSC